MSSGEVPSGVSRTAVWTAGVRARESERPDRWFDDQLAGVFASTAGIGLTPEESVAVMPGVNEIMAIRTRFFDDQMRAACAAGIRQVVVFAAGLDSRAFRLDWPDNVQLYELDLPSLFAFKEPVLASVGAVARCGRGVVAVDLRGQWADALSAAGFDPGAATMWLAEGLLSYLKQADVDRLLATVTELSAPGSQMAFDYIEHAGLDRLATYTTSTEVRQVSALLNPDEVTPVGWLAAHGWQHSRYGLQALGQHYGRPLPADTDWVLWNANILVAASRAATPRPDHINLGLPSH
jgi:methyltransferase (TIGR00027 family)